MPTLFLAAVVAGPLAAMRRVTRPAAVMGMQGCRRTAAHQFCQAETCGSAGCSRAVSAPAAAFYAVIGLDVLRRVFRSSQCWMSPGSILSLDLKVGPCK